MASSFQIFVKRYRRAVEEYGRLSPEAYAAYQRLLDAQAAAR